MDEDLQMGDFTTVLDKKPDSDFEPISDLERVAILENRQELKEIKKDIAERLDNPQYPKLNPMQLKALKEKLDQKHQECKVRVQPTFEECESINAKFNAAFHEF